ncbi:MAG: prolipoprotein diacylglyceryl transferase [Spirochaetota bacterium]|jgi:phosphatidylglycerol:prolipoprotein diacylglycerol transferase|nr:prolipoprotein diacylglyceryl transferase [Spirochaetota bacterium]
MRPVLITFTFETLFPLLIILALLSHGIALCINKRHGNTKKVPEKIITYINSMRSLGNTLFILAAVVLVAFKALGMEQLPLHSYGLMLAVAFLSAIGLAERRAPLENIAPRDIGILSIGIIVAALIGSRLFYHLFEVPPKNLLDIFAVWRGGLVVYGGIICAVATVWVMMVRRKMPVGATFDVFSAPLALGIFLGRIGCFFAGCCYGNATEHICGMVFPKDAQVYGHLHNIVARASENPETYSMIPPNFVEHITAQNYDLVPVHPTQLYESLLALAGFFLILLFYKKKGFNGETFLWVLGYYAIIRFFLETMRIDTPHNLFLGSFSLSQAIGLIALPVIIGVIIFGRIRARALSAHNA